MSFRVAVINRKGGVSKTTTVLCLADHLQQRGRSVLVVDMDPQGNATLGFDVAVGGDVPEVYDILGAHRPGQAAAAASPAGRHWTGDGRLEVIPSSTRTAHFEIGEVIAAEMRLRAALDDGGDAEFDFTLIDCPPALGRLTVNALAAAHAVLIPAEPAVFAVDGLREMLGTIGQVQEQLNPTLDILGILPTRTPFPFTTEAGNQLRDLSEQLGDLVLTDLAVPLKKTIPESQTAGAPLSRFTTMETDPAYRAYSGVTDLLEDAARG